jgi:8-amino-7-oxononanoate synthase
LVGTFSKSLASIGGFAAGSVDLMHLLRFTARKMIFSACLPPADVAVVHKALEIIEAEGHILIPKVWANSGYLRQGLQDIGFIVGGDSPILSILLDDDKARGALFHQMLLAEGIDVSMVLPPASPRTIFRAATMPQHTQEHLDQALTAFATIGKLLGYIA